MKRHQLLIIFMLFTCNVSSFSQRIDTLYYDSAGKGVETKEFATYTIYASYAKDSNYSNKFRAYNTASNMLCGEGDFISVDKYDLGKTVYDNEVKLYYNNGKPQQVAHYQKGKYHGEVIGFYENRQVQSCCE